VEFAGAYVKINGDYTTDPSRKNVDMDDISQKSFDNAVTVIVDTVVGILENRTAQKGFFSPFVNVTGREGSKFRGLLFKMISNKLARKTLKNFNGQSVKFSSIRLRPDWLNYEDYERLCHDGISYLSKDLVTFYPELPVFLEHLGVKKLYLEETLEKVNAVSLTNTGAGQISAKIINQYRYDLTSERIDKIKDLKIFPTKDKFVCAREISTIDKVDKNYSDYIFKNVEHHDLKPFFSKLNIPIDSRISDDKAKQEILSDTKLAPHQRHGEAGPKSLFKAVPNIQKWRSAEKNALEYFNAIDGVVSVSDVSNANMGYDLEVFLASGKRLYIEIKSVSSFSEPIKITNNEYSSAHSYGSSYYLAIVINDEPFQVRLIPDPIRNLSFEKQIERWSWFCDSYRTNLKNIEELLSALSNGGEK
jgi:hypothetical protein